VKREWDGSFVTLLCINLFVGVNLRPFHPGDCSPESFPGSGLRFVLFVPLCGYSDSCLHLCAFASLREIFFFASVKA